VERKLHRFEIILETFRKDLRIPGMAAVIVKDRKVIWAKGFGYADMNKKTEATPETPFHIASMTKPIAATLCLQLMEQGALDLNEPFSEYGINIGKGQLTHLLTHTSDGVPGSEFRYSGYRYGYIGIAMKSASGKSFKTLLEQRILQPLKMENSAPNFVDPEIIERFRSYCDERGYPGCIRDEKGVEYELCDLYDYSDPLYGRTYALACNLVAGALENALVEGEYFRVPQILPIDAASKRNFNGFWLADNRYLHVYRNLAKPYDLDSVGTIIHGQYSMFFNPAAGLISTAGDLAKFDIALDEHRIISEETKEFAFTPMRAPSGAPFPYGIGWFVQEYDGVKLVWHAGEWDCISALYLKVPQEALTFIVLANAPSMSSAFSMGEGDVLNSGVGLAFLRLFVFEEKYNEMSPDIDWKTFSDEIAEEIRQIKSEGMKDLYRKQVRNMETMFLRIGPVEVFHELVKGVHPLLMVQEESQITGKKILAKIADIGNNEHRVVDFELAAAERVRIYCIGEAWDGEEFDYGWIESITSGEILWRMEFEKTMHAGGSVKNRKADTDVQLLPGRYRLHYRSDDSHAYGSWNAAPPDDIFWGIVVYTEDK
jgi:CubicO group peptidase (beta-lactamase class C family)